jgi:gliding motility-associated lipoprotein GldD
MLPACNSPYTIKPKAYPRIDLPQHSYTTFDTSFCPCTFEYPVYARVERDSVYFGDVPEHPCWINVVMPSLNATLYLNYKALGNYTLTQLLEDAHKLTYKHVQRADYIEPVPIETPNGVHGLIYDVGGNAASPLQFFATDTVNHYLRGSLYIHARVNRDSLNPVINFLVEDVTHLIESLKWREDFSSRPGI